MKKNKVEKITSTFWCDKCRTVSEIDVINGDDACPVCDSELEHMHRVSTNVDGVKDVIVVTKDNYKNVLPPNLIYFYKQLLGHTMTYSCLDIADFSLSRNALSVDNKKWYK